MELSRMTAFMKAVAVAMAFSVDGVLGMILGDGVAGMVAGVWAWPGKEALRVIVVRTSRGYSMGLVMVQK
jgi:hypothetical protein